MKLHICALQMHLWHSLEPDGSILIPRLWHFMFGKENTILSMSFSQAVFFFFYYYCFLSKDKGEEISVGESHKEDTRPEQRGEPLQDVSGGRVQVTAQPVPESSCPGSVPRGWQLSPCRAAWAAEGPCGAPDCLGDTSLSCSSSLWDEGLSGTRD